MARRYKETWQESRPDVSGRCVSKLQTGFSAHSAAVLSDLRDLRSCLFQNQISIEAKGLCDSRLMVCLLRHGDSQAAAQSLPVGLTSGTECYVSLSGPEGDLYRTISSPAPAGSRTLSRRTAAECESRYQRDHVHRLRFVRAGMPRKSDCGYQRPQRADPPQRTYKLYLRP